MQTTRETVKATWTMKVVPLLAAATMLMSGTAFAQDAYPSKPIRMIVPLPPGGPGDALARSVATPLSKLLNVPIVVENRGGAGGSLGVSQLAKLPNDGYTIGLVSAGTQSINPFIYSTLAYDPGKDFEAVSPLASYVNVVICNPKLAANSMAELIAMAKAKPGSVTVGTGGNGTSSHLALEVIKFLSGAPIQHIPYRGGGPALIDLLGGNISCVVDALAVPLPHVHSGRLKALAVSSATRSVYAPQIPTMAESGLQGFPEASGQLWMGLVAPAGTPKAIVDKLNAAIQQVLRADPATRKTFETQGFDAMLMPAPQFFSFMQRDRELWGNIVKSSGAKAD